MYNQPMLKEDALKGKTVLITGGGTGLGRSMGKYFLELGANLVIASRKIEVLNETAEELRTQTSGQVLALECDVRNYADVEKTIQSAKDKFGNVDVLVNNAAGNFISPTEKLSSKAFDIVVDIVLKGSYNFTLAMGKDWIASQRPGCVLNIVTTYAFTGSGFVVPSAIAKAGVLTLTRSLSIEWAKYKIRMNAIAPGPFPTEGAWSRLFPESISQKVDMLKRLPYGRVGEHQELANLAAYLISDFSSYVNGEVITIDGGEWLKGAGEFNYLDELSPEMWEEVIRNMRGK